MKLSIQILALATTLSGGSAGAAPIILLNAEPAARDTAVTRCTTLPVSANGPDIECVVTLAPPAPGARTPSRILIRTEVGRARCASNDAQVVRLSSPLAAARRLLLVEHAGDGRACGS